MKGLFVLAYGLAWGWIIRKNGYDTKLCEMVMAEYEDLVRWTTRIRLSEQNKYLDAICRPSGPDRVTDDA